MEKRGSYLNYAKKYKKRFLLLPFFILLFFILFSAIILQATMASDDVFTAGDMTASVHVGSSIDVVPSSNYWELKDIFVDQTFFPRESWNQHVLSLQTNPQAENNGTALKYSWESPKEQQLSFSMDSEVRITYGYLPVSKKIHFPIENLPEEYRDYTIPQNNIDSDNRAIIDKANDLAKGNDDLYLVVFGIANWVEGNVNYSLDTLTADSSQKASWVLQNREGVCDELTSLFIAMLRSLGIPARYVSGVAYTNYNDLDNFGPHAWAEVYFPDYGWVPFDVTYGEFGFVDSGHIKLKQTFDSNEAAVNYKWDGRNVDLKTNNLDITANIISLGSKIQPMLSISVNPLKDKVKIGSYNLIEADVTNLNNFYVPTEIYISRSTGMQVLGNTRQQILLLPKQTKKVFWVVKVNDNLDNDYVYTYTIQITSPKANSAETLFSSSIRDQNYNLGYIQSILLQYDEENLKTYSRSIEMNCTISEQGHYIGYHNGYYTGENIPIKCTLRNDGNTQLKSISVCYQNICSSLDLGISEQKSADFTSSFDITGPKSMVITAKSPEITKSSSVDVEILDNPNINITDIRVRTDVVTDVITDAGVSEKIEYGKQYNLEFTVKKESISFPENTVLTLQSPVDSKQWNLGNLSQDRQFFVAFDSGQLNDGENNFSLILDYTDGLGRKYSFQKSISVKVSDPSFFQNISLKMNRYLGFLSKPMNIIIASIGAIIILAILFYAVGNRTKPKTL